MNWTRKLLQFLFTLICFILSIIPMILFIVLLFICTIFKGFLKIYLNFKHNEKIQLLNGSDALFTISNQKLEVTGNAFLVFEGEINLNSIKKALKTSWTNKHLKMRSKIAKCCGYFYWLPQTNFNLDRHIRIYNCKPLTNDEEMFKISLDICNRPLPDDIPPWMIYAVPLSDKFVKYSGKPHFLLILRLHHCLCDGISSALMISDCFLDENNAQYTNPKLSETTLMSQILNLIITTYYFPSCVVEALLHPDKNILHGPKQTGNRLFGSSSYLSLDRVKRVGKITGTTVNDILTSCVVGALGRFFVKMGEDLNKPIRAYIPTAMPRSGDKVFTNNSTSYVLKLSFKKKYNAIERLNEIRRLMIEQKNAYFHLVAYYGPKLIANQLPQCLSQIIPKATNGTLIITNISWWQHECVSKFGGNLKACSVYSTHCFDQAIGFAITSYNGNIHITMSADKAVIDDVKDVEWILEMCIEDFEDLEKYI